MLFEVSRQVNEQSANIELTALGVVGTVSGVAFATRVAIGELLATVVEVVKIFREKRDLLKK